MRKLVICEITTLKRLLQKHSPFGRAEYYSNSVNISVEKVIIFDQFRDKHAKLSVRYIDILFTNQN